MAIIIISSSSLASRRELAENLAKKLDYPCLSREKLVEDAMKKGIAVGRLEVAMIKKPILPERLARLKDLYLAYVTSALCEYAEDGNLVYHGRAGHLLLRDVTHIFRVQVVPELEYRIKEVMERLKLNREKSMEYIRQIDEDIDRWVRYVHGMDRNDPTQYDVIINLERMSLFNASMAICAMAELPDFQQTPASKKAFSDAHLAARAQIKLALDEHTSRADLNVRANDGVLNISYMPRQSHVAEWIPQVLDDLEGCKEILCTMADTNILWIQEKYDANSEVYYKINQVAQKWGAAIEILRWVPSYSQGEDQDWRQDSSKSQRVAAQSVTEQDNKIEDDLEEASDPDDGGITSTIERLVNAGRSGGSHTVKGTPDKLLAAISRDVKYSLVVIGNIHLSKPPSVQARMARELRVFLQERLNLPVIESSIMGEKLFFRKKQLIKLLIFLTLVVGIYALVFTHQMQILDFLGGEFHERRPWLTSLGVAAFVPLIAYLYSTVTGLILKFIRFE